MSTIKTLVEFAFTASFPFADACGIATENMRDNNVTDNLADVVRDVEAGTLLAANPNADWSGEDWKAAVPRISDEAYEATIEYLTKLHEHSQSIPEDAPVYDVFVAFGRAKQFDADREKGKGASSGRLGRTAPAASDGMFN